MNNTLRKNFVRTILSVLMVIFTILPSVAHASTIETVGPMQTQVSIPESVLSQINSDISALFSIEDRAERVLYFSNTYSTRILPDYVNIAAYRDWNFTSKSCPEFVEFSKNCNAISLIASCEGEIDTAIICEIVDMDHGGLYSQSLLFAGDESTKTYPLTLPAGRYKVWFVGDVNILKKEALVVFSHVNESILSINEFTFRYQKNILLNY